jgi:hypothetical protein
LTCCDITPFQQNCCIDAGEEEDGYDETILPTDHKQTGQIRDTELARAIVHRLPAGVVVHALFDSCHSGAHSQKVKQSNTSQISVVPGI